MKEFKPRDKLTQRMTRDGAVLDNQATGEEIHISERDAEKRLSTDGQPVQMGKRDAPMNPADDTPKHGRQLRPQEQKEPEKEQPKPQQPSAEPFQPQSGSPVSHIPQDIPTSAAPGGTAGKLLDRAAAEHDRQTARMSRDAAQQRYSASRLQFSEEERAAPELHKHERLFALLPYKTLYLSSVKDRHGVFAFISKDERRDLPLRRQRSSVRAQLKEGQSKKTAAPKKAAAKTKDNDLEV